MKRHGDATLLIKEMKALETPVYFLTYIKCESQNCFTMSILYLYLEEQLCVQFSGVIT